MPNRTGAKLKSKRAKAPETLDEIIEQSETENTEVTSATETRPDVPDFTSEIEDAPADYKPNRSPAGRTRIPSQFDSVLPQYHGQGWKRIQHDGNVVVDENGKATPDSVKGSNAHVIKRELQKAQHYLGLGMDLNITQTHVEFKVRDLQKRKAKDGEQADADGNVIDEVDDFDENVED
jgi:hypothetical protein